MDTTPAVPETIEDGTPVGEIIARRNAEQRIDAAEAADNGHRLALLMGWEVLSIADAPVTFVADEESEIPTTYDDALIGQAAAKASEWRDELDHKRHHLRKHAPPKVHLEALRSIAQLDEFLDTVADYFREQSA